MQYANYVNTGKFLEFHSSCMDLRNGVSLRSINFKQSFILSLKSFIVSHRAFCPLCNGDFFRQNDGDLRRASIAKTNRRPANDNRAMRCSLQRRQEKTMYEWESVCVPASMCVCVWVGASVRARSFARRCWVNCFSILVWQPRLLMSATVWLCASLSVWICCCLCFVSGNSNNSDNNTNFNCFYCSSL